MLDVPRHYSHARHSKPEGFPPNPSHLSKRSSLRSSPSYYSASSSRLPLPETVRWIPSIEEKET
uniref:Uncharacterized protein n=1 Tax=Anguilla anguilla TaxID=7936 RepID=A0A0E9W889_ANGAN